MSAISNLAQNSFLNVMRRPGEAHLFTHCVLELTVCDAHLAALSERAVILAQADDVVVTHASLETAYFEYLAELGIGPRPDRILSVDSACGAVRPASLSQQIVNNNAILVRLASLLADCDSVCINPYICRPPDVELAKRLEKRLGKPTVHLGGDPAAVDQADQKHLVRAKAIELGTPVAPGQAIAVANEAKRRVAEFQQVERAIRRFLPQTGKVLVRPTCSAFGVGARIVRNSEQSIRQTIAALESHPDSNIYLIESMFSCTHSPNVGMFIDPATKDLTCVSVTDQTLRGDVTHIGNRFPSRAKTVPHMIDQAHRLSAWLAETGVTGHVGFDFCEYLDAATGEPRHFLAEINPRINGATYAHELAFRLHRKTTGVGAFLSDKLHTNVRSFAQFREHFGEFLFTPEKESGIIPFCVGLLKSHQSCYLAYLAQNDRQLQQLHDEFHRRLNEFEQRSPLRAAARNLPLAA